MNENIVEGEIEKNRWKLTKKKERKKERKSKAKRITKERNRKKKRNDIHINEEENKLI